MAKIDEYIENIWEKILEGKYPEYYYAAEVVKILLEESQNEKYTNHNGNYHISFTLRFLKGRLKNNRIKIRRVTLGKTILTLLIKKDLEYDHKKRSGPASTCYLIDYSNMEIKALLKDFEKIEKRTNKIYLFS